LSFPEEARKMNKSEREDRWLDRYWGTEDRSGALDRYGEIQVLNIY
jgi:hypothetical protein